MTLKMNSAKPVRKVQAATIGSALSTVLIWLLNDFVLPKPVPDMVVPAVVVLCTFFAGYLTPPGADERVETTRAPGPVTP